MPVINQAPENISIPKLTDSERQSRISELSKTLQLYKNIRSKVSKALPMFDEILHDLHQFQKNCDSVPTLRALRLNRRLVIDPLTSFVHSSRAHFAEFEKMSARAERNMDGLEEEILSPELLR